ncbi:MAG: virulence RhuM family protein [Bacteroidales bacterium]|nr:virulence RhuM family protein [Bacteroidales bacterium]
MKETPTSQGEIILYNPNDTIRINVRLENDTVWLTQAQMATLFGRNRTVIGKHISNIFKEGELVQDMVCAFFAHTTLHGAIESKQQTHTVLHYNLDVIISVGYRVKSIQGTLFRQWSNKVLKNYLLQGHVINQRIENLEKTVAQHTEQIGLFVKTALPPCEGIYFQGQIFDAYVFISGLIKQANNRIILIDNYIDETVLMQLTKRKECVPATIYTNSISQQLELDIQRHNLQYQPISVKKYKKAHDRFLIIDDKIYLIGASIKDLGKKMFGLAELKTFSVEKIINELEL